MSEDHEAILIRLAEALAEARRAADAATQSLTDAVRAAHAAGVSKYRIGQITGLARATIDKWTRGAT